MSAIVVLKTVAMLGRYNHFRLFSRGLRAGAKKGPSAVFSGSRERARFGMERTERFGGEGENQLAERAGLYVSAFSAFT